MAEWDASDSAGWSGDATDDTTVGDSPTTEATENTFPLDNGLQDQVEEQKIWRIKKNEIEELKTERSDGIEKFVTIFKRTEKGRPLEVCREKFPRKALAAFSERWKKQVDREGNTGFLVIEEFSGNMLPYDLILNWIDLCIDEGNDVKFPEIEEGQNQLDVLLNVIAVADFLKIPGKSLQEPLKKAAIRYARKNLIDIDYVGRLYDTSEPYCDGDIRPLQEAAAASIFEAWWTRQLDEPEFDEYASYVEQLRAEFDQLDQDLNARFDEKKGFIEKKREERRTKGSVVPAVSDFGAVVDGADGGWGTAATEAAAGQDEWAADGANGANGANGAIGANGANGANGGEDLTSGDTVANGW